MAKTKDWPRAIAQYLKTPVHTVFQVSTSGALVAGVYAGIVSVQSLLQHGDFGLGTFANLDGEMVVLDGHVYQIQGNGRVSEAPPTARAPFAVVTRFLPETDLKISSIANLSGLQKRCDALRTSGNIFLRPPTRRNIQADSDPGRRDFGGEIFFYHPLKVVLPSPTLVSDCQ